MYIEAVPNRSSPPAILLREGHREGGRVVKKTIANLSHWPMEKIETFRRLLKDEPLVSVDDALRVERSVPHGHVMAVLGTLRKLGLEALLSSQSCRERDLVVGMIAERLIHPGSKLATTRTWHHSSLADELGVADAQVEELYAALDWLLARKDRIEAKLAKRHLGEGSLVLYDASTSFYTGRTCPLARFGHDRDKSGFPVIAYGLLTNAEGCPVGVEVYPGNTGDPSTVADQVHKVKAKFSLSSVVVVGDRGMLTQAQIDRLKQQQGVEWISCLRSSSIRELVNKGAVQPSLFDEQNLAEIVSPDFPGERLVACFNPFLADERKRKRAELLAMTERHLESIGREVRRRTKKPLGKDEIGIKAGRVLGRYKMGKHFLLTIGEGTFEWKRREDAIAREARLDGIYVIRTCVPKDKLSAEDAVRTYKSLSLVERAFRCLKGVDLLIRPIHHRSDNRVRAHIFLCMLAYYVEWHMRRALAPLLFHDEDLDADRRRRDPVAPAQPSPSARRKKNTKRTDDGLPVHSFKDLLSTLGLRAKVLCRFGVGPAAPIVTRLADATPVQARAFDLLGLKG
jgi:Transposase DDE domain